MHTLYKNNYMHLPKFISTDEAYSLYLHLENSKNSGNYSPHDLQFSNTPCFSNNLELVKILVREVPRVSHLIGEPVLPTYVYGRLYKNGDVLHRHRDREACEISITLNIFQDVEWDIFIETPRNEEVSLNLHSGDAMLYLGCVADHWRNAYSGTKYGQIFLHYVKANGKNAIHFFDKIHPFQRKETK